jgi:hypothetical protein
MKGALSTVVIGLRSARKSTRTYSFCARNRLLSRAAPARLTNSAASSVARSAPNA